MNTSGTVTIYLNITRSVDTIELHSKELVIEKAIVVESLIMTKSAKVSRISSNPERESITIHLNRTILPDEELMLQINYHGIAKLDEYGLYENWDPKFNKSLDSNGPYILATNNFPTGARFWFPCFDEPDKKATFDLQINHPSGLNAYSNTDLDRTKSISKNRKLSVFKKTRSLATYQVALSINHLSIQTLEVKGCEKVTLISSKNSHDYWSSVELRENAPGKYGVKRNDIQALLKESLEFLTGMTIEYNGKLEIVVLEGTSSDTFQPGLVTINRKSFWKGDDPNEELFNFLAQLVYGNPVKTTDQLWLSNLFTYIGKEFHPRDARRRYIDPILSYDILDSSLHETSLRHQMIHTSTTKQFLSSRMKLPSRKVSHLVLLLRRYCPSSFAKIQQYSLSAFEKESDIDDFLGTATKSCKDPKIAEEFLSSFINQPGKALLTVKRSNSSVRIEQTRYHSSYFDASLRDNKTRFTIPISYNIDGEYQVKVFRSTDSSLEINVQDTSLFLIDHEFEHLYLVYYDDRIIPERNITELERSNLLLALQKSLIAAINIGYVKYTRINDQLNYYSEKRIFDLDYYHEMLDASRQFLFDDSWNMEYIEDTAKLYTTSRCEDWPDSRTNWDGAYNNETWYWRTPTYIDDIMRPLNCLTEWSNSTIYNQFLEDNFLFENTDIRPELIPFLPRRIRGHQQWRELHRFFFRNAANICNHRFDLLADTVLNQARMGAELNEDYPNEHIRDDYLKELHDFIIRTPERAASMSTEIKMRLEREYIRRELPKFHNETGSRIQSYSSKAYLDYFQKKDV